MFYEVLDGTRKRKQMKKRKEKKLRRLCVFGLGDLNYRLLHEWATKNKITGEEQIRVEMNGAETACIYYAMALTMAGVTRTYNNDHYIKR